MKKSMKRFWSEEKKRKLCPATNVNIPTSMCPAPLYVAQPWGPAPMLPLLLVFVCQALYLLHCPVQPYVSQPQRPAPMLPCCVLLLVHVCQALCLLHGGCMTVARLGGEPFFLGLHEERPSFLVGLADFHFQVVATSSLCVCVCVFVVVCSCLVCKSN